MDWSGILKRNISVAGGDGFKVFLAVSLTDWPDYAIRKETAKKIMYEHFDNLKEIPLGMVKAEVYPYLIENKPRLGRFMQGKKKFITYRIEKTGELK